jgi:hypothetical protein
MLGELRLIHVSERKMRCVFHTLVVKRNALKEKYDGGVKAFAEKHVARFNKDLAIICVMSGEDLDEAILYIRRSGLKLDEDYKYFHALTITSEEIIHEMPELAEETDFGTEWLRGYPHDRGMMVYYVDEECSEKEDD